MISTARIVRRMTLATAVGLAALLLPAAARAQAQTPPPTQTPVPKPAPFPAANAPATTKPATPAAPTAASQGTGIQEGGSIDPRLSGIPIYPGAELLESFDGAGGQRVFLFGSTMPYSDVLAFYKAQLRGSGSEIFKTPAIQQFDLGSFRAETMAYRPSVVLKDYGTTEPAGYLHIVGTTEKRYRTVIQIVPK